MTQAIVLSNNSPGLLRTFLISYKKHAGHLFNVSVLFSSSEDNLSQYQELFKEFEITETVEQANFRYNILSLLENGSSKLVTFFKDTNYFFSEIPDVDLENIMSNDNIFCFSLSLGRNIKHCYHNDVYNILLNEEVNSENTLAWNWVKHYLDFGRPLELGGGHIFHRKEIYKIFKRWKFENVQSLEDNFDQLEYYPKELMSSFNNSVLVDIISKEDGDLNKIGSYDFSTLDRKIIEL
jgi:hypothetical protein